MKYSPILVPGVSDLGGTKEVSHAIELIGGVYRYDRFKVMVDTPIVPTQISQYPRTHAQRRMDARAPRGGAGQVEMNSTLQ